jgi:hypothetical protein
MKVKKTLVGTLAIAIAAVSVVVGAALAYGHTPKSAPNPIRATSHLGGAAKRHMRKESGGPAAIIDLVNSMTADVGGNSTTAAQTLSEVRADVGSAHESLYTFQPATSTTCFVLWKRTAACPNAQTEALHPGVVFVGGGGIPARASTTGVSMPAVLVGTAGSNVRTITLVQDGRAQQLPIVSNTFFTELTPATGTTPDMLQIMYSDGRSTSLRIPAPGT